jgi:molybdopterin-containing oxidoreductase family membrane subunit
MAWYSGSTFEWALTRHRFSGDYAWSYWLLIFFNAMVLQLLWFRSVRRNVAALFVISICVNIGMWLERFVIVVTSLYRDYVPSAWGFYVPTFWDYATFLGTLGLFFSLLFLFIRFLPVISMFEMRELRAHQTEPPKS